MTGENNFCGTIMGRHPEWEFLDSFQIVWKIMYCLLLIFLFKLYFILLNT